MNKLTDYVKTAEAARILGVSQNTLRTWAAAGKIKHRRKLSCAVSTAFSSRPKAR